MKQLLLFLLLFLVQSASAQSLDYISVRKRNGRVVKNVYTGSSVLMQLDNGRYLQGPVQTIQNDSVYVTLYDIRYYRTNYGSVLKDTVSTSVVGVRYSQISRIFLNRRKGFFQRAAGPVLKIGGAGYLALNLLNGDLFDPSLTDSKNLRKLGFSAGAFGLGYLFDKLFSTDGFSSRRNQIVYVDL